MLGRHREEREEIHPLHRFLHPVDRLVAPDLRAFQIALEQGVVGGRDGFDELLVVLVEGLLLVGRDVGFGVVARLGTGRVEVRLAGEEVDHAAEGGAAPDGDFDRDDLAGETLLDLQVDAIEVGVLLVHHRDDEEDRVAARDRFMERLFGPHLDATLRAHDADHAVGGRDTGDRVAVEVEVPRGVDQVDLGVHPLGVCAAQADGVAPLGLLGGMVGEGRSLLDGAVPFT